MISFRQIRADDFTPLGELSAEFSAAVKLRAIEDWKPAGICTGWVACANDERRVGTVLACRETGELLALIVDPEFQSKRVGSELLRQAEAWLFSHGWTAITATSKHIPEYSRLNHGWTHDSEIQDKLAKMSSPELKEELFNLGIKRGAPKGLLTIRLVFNPAKDKDRNLWKKLEEKAKENSLDVNDLVKEIILNYLKKTK